MSYRNLDDTHCHLEDFKAAEDFYERRLKIAKELGIISVEGTAYGDPSNIYF